MLQETQAKGDSEGDFLGQSELEFPDLRERKE